MTSATFTIIDNNNRPGEVVFNDFRIDHDFVPTGSEKQTKWALDIIKTALREMIVDGIQRWHRTTNPNSGSKLPTFLTNEQADKIKADADRTLAQWFAAVDGKPAKFFIDAKMNGKGSAGDLYKAAVL